MYTFIAASVQCSVPARDDFWTFVFDLFLRLGHAILWFTYMESRNIYMLSFITLKLCGFKFYVLLPCKKLDITLLEFKNDARKSSFRVV